MRAAGGLDPGQIARIGEIVPFRVARAPQQSRGAGQDGRVFNRETRLHEGQRAGRQPLRASPPR